METGEDLNENRDRKVGKSEKSEIAHVVKYHSADYQVAEVNGYKNKVYDNYRICTKN